jgi:hypothetical protein
VKLVRVHITDHHLRAGEPRNCLNCAAAMAFRQALPGARVAIFGSTFEINGRRYRSPAALVAFVHSYDEQGLIPGAPAADTCEFTVLVEDGVSVRAGYEVEEVKAA